MTISLRIADFANFFLLETSISLLLPFHSLLIEERATLARYLSLVFKIFSLWLTEFARRH